MRTKSFGVKKLLSLVLAIAMMATMILPTSVFAAAPAVDGDAVATVLKAATGVDLVKQITVTFDSEIKFDDSKFATDVTVNNGHNFGTSEAKVDDTDAKKLVITLTDDATVEVGDKITFANDVIIDKATETDPFNGEVTIDGNLTGAEVTFDVPAGVTVTVEGGTAPTYYGIGTYAYKAEGAGFETVEDTFDVTDADFTTPKNIPVAISEIAAVDFTATAVATNVAATYGKADKIVIVFAEPINATEQEVFAQLDINTKTKDPVWTVDKTVLTLTVDGDIANGTVINYTKAATIKTTSGKIVADGSATIAGNFDGAKDLVTATSMTATIVKGAPFKPEVQDADSIVLVFNAPVVETGDIEIVVGSETLTATGDATKTIYTIDLDGAENIENATQAVYGSIVATLNGSFGEARAPRAMKAYAIDNDGTELVYNKVDGTVYKDQIVVVFDTPTNEADDISKISVVGTGYTASLGTKAELDWEEDGTKLVITLGQDTVIRNGATIDLTNLGIMDKDGIISADDTTLELAIEGSFGYTIQPRITKAVAFTQNDMDYIRVFFNTEVKAKAGETIDVAISGFTMGASASKVLVDQNNGLTYYEIAMAKDEHSSFESGRYTISLTGIVDKGTGSKELASTPVTITGAFISPITPEVLKVVAISNDGSGVAKTGDKIVAVFNTEVKLGTVEAVDGYLGAGSSVGHSSAAKNVVEITLGGADLNIQPGTTKIKFTGFKDEATETVTMGETTEIIDGSFGYSVEPEILKATAVSADGSGVPKAGDKIVVVFNTMVTYAGADIYYYEYTLATDGEYDIGDVFSITVGSKATGLKYPLTKEITGTFGYSVAPAVKSVILSEREEIEKITVVFDRATNMQSIENVALATFRTNNAHLGADATAMWAKDTVLEITLGAAATTTNADVLNLSELGIKAADTKEDIDNINALKITGSLVSVVKDVVAENGGKIRITFTTRTNADSINLEPSAALYGEGATASWVDAKTLLITLGTDYGINERGYISLDNLGITDGYSGSYVVSGQYKIQSGSFTSDALEAKSAIAKSATTTVTDAAAGDKITITFSYATDKNANLANIISEVKSGDAVVANPFGTGATCEWITSQKLVITLGDAPEIKRDDVIYFNKTNIKTLSGQELTTESVALKGSFDGRDYYLSGNYVAQTATAKDHSFKVVVDNTSDAVAAKPTIVCVAYNGNTPVAISRVSAGIDETAEFVFTFSGSYTITNAKVYAFKGLFDDITDTTASPEVLAETKTINK